MTCQYSKNYVNPYLLIFFAVLWIRNDFFSDPIPDTDPTFQRVPDPIPDPDPDPTPDPDPLRFLK